jgi:SAM-dependent methyltransferase
MNDDWTEKWTNRWDERFGNEAFAYGEDPNNYLKEQLLKLPPGKILFPAEGEGRNAVYAAKLGWIVSAFDISVEGKKKALKLAKLNGVEIDYQLGKLETLHFKEEQFDAIAFIYAHFPADIKSQFHRTLNKYLRTGGTIIFEAFSKSHIDYIRKNEAVGGPKDIDMLFSIEEIKLDFSNYDFIELSEKEIELQEGSFHNVTGSVIRFVGRKK